ncbi:conserved unknown protein [Ectocarpus siliculosus]|uniref:Uncharacterized protein n=1 Tax=Ectocarpus siliculosus TaxID=2880 RepID=D8LGZ6_ECTSI|nr:conserved unknown protein [Ectocarpus siliculosus]|eukprot:CBN75849.1 conserved unknown protein [Ectocarpus siliculosus]
MLNAMVATSLTTILLVVSLPPALMLVLTRVTGKRRIAYLPGKVIWITGASSGLGEQLAISAAAGGAEGLILSGRREDALERVKGACEATAKDREVRVRLLPFDVADLEFAEKEAAARALGMFGRVDALVLNAGISTRGSVAETPLEVDRRVMAVNYFGPVGLAKGLLEATRDLPPPETRKTATSTGATAVLATPTTPPEATAADTFAKGSGSGPTTTAAGGPGAGSGSEGVRFVVVNSVQGKFGMANRSSYAASKHALVGFFDSLRAEQARRGVGVLNIFPGYVRTSLSVNALTADGTKHAQMDATTAQGRDPREVADEIWQAVSEDQDEVVIADLKTKVAVLLRALAPRVLFRIMAKRALKAKEGAQ